MKRRKTKLGDTRVTRVVVPRNVIDVTWTHLSRKGQLGEEEMALWSGYRMNGCGFVTTVILPLTRSYPGYVTIDDDQRLARLWESITTQRQCLLVQLHTHGGLGWHSATDDHGCISDTTGMFSIVVPHFAYFGFRGFDGPGMGIYERQVSGVWEQLDADAVRKRFQTVDSEIKLI